MSFNHKSRDGSPLVLCILDGWGIAPAGSYNAVSQAHLPNWTRWFKNCPLSQLSASGEDVGLPEGQMGNSEVGHTTIGAGRALLQDLPRITRSFQENEVASLPLMKSFIQEVLQGTGVCHIMGLLSSGGVHSHQDHMIGFLKILNAAGVRTYVHCFLDGRDTPPKSAQSFLNPLISQIQTLPMVRVGTIMGRFYGMDRDHRWDRTERAFKAILLREGQSIDDLTQSIKNFYEDGVTDEFIPPLITKEYPGVSKGDGLFMVNFRADRVQQLLSSFLLEEFEGFVRETYPYFGPTLGMKSYSRLLDPVIPSLFPKEYPHHTLGEIIAQAGLHQLRAAETEKYAHVTFFFNGGREEPYPLEDRLLVPSSGVKTYDLQPEMSAEILTDQVIEKLKSKTYDFVVINFANPDMVGHTGNFNATIKALEVVDNCLGRLADYLDTVNGKMIVTADHGNAEHMQEQGHPHTAHTTNLVPFLLVGFEKEIMLKPFGALEDVAPTILSLLNHPMPREMTGCSLVIS